LPSDLQELADKQFNEKALLERADWQKMTAAEQKNLQSKGMVFNTPAKKPFQDALRRAGFYTAMKKKSGDKAWVLLEQYTGALS
jgi:TRAP-type transport system periplasmic protein